MNPNFQPSFLKHPKKLENINNLYLKTDYGIVDFLTEIQNLGDFSRVKRNSIEISLFGKKVRLISLDDLISVKSKMNRPKDKIVLNELLEIRKNLQN